MPMQRRATPNPSMILVAAGVGEIEYPDTGPSSSGPRMGMSCSPICRPNPGERAVDVYKAVTN
ncbi:hypothetical protein M378DRAFT_168339 [Amanita muscaria Koide BX008]|uniref:Uncharacterized protein n=1 Tax=Amanita muscaria (strain Koide BX008) TaxID=946122 RepID=A0A0C2WV42_AMAMK|nr:hypothetical protein M378DRAFT_168339 [Amanita muscaria Koide BX008]